MGEIEFVCTVDCAQAEHQNAASNIVAKVKTRRNTVINSPSRTFGEADGLGNNSTSCLIALLAVHWEVNMRIRSDSTKTSKDSNNVIVA